MAKVLTRAVVLSVMKLDKLGYRQTSQALKQLFYKCFNLYRVSRVTSLQQINGGNWKKINDI